LLGRPVAACEACRRRCGRRHQRRTRQQRQRPSKAVAAMVVVAAVRLIRGGAAGMAAAALREDWAVGSRCPSTNASGNRSSGCDSGSSGGVVVVAVIDSGSLNLTSVSFHLWLSFSPAAPSTHARVCVCVCVCVCVFSRPCLCTFMHRQRVRVVCPAHRVAASVPSSSSCLLR
jgi:hypothetical protein